MDLSRGFHPPDATSVLPLILAIVSFFTCGFATPHIHDAGQIDLRHFHNTHGRKCQLAYAAFMLVAIIQTPLMTPDAVNLPGYWIDVTVQLAIALTCIACAIFRRQTWL